VANFQINLPKFTLIFFNEFTAPLSDSNTTLAGFVSFELTVLTVAMMKL